MCASAVEEIVGTRRRRDEVVEVVRELAHDKDDLLAGPDSGRTGPIPHFMFRSSDSAMRSAGTPRRSSSSAVARIITSRPHTNAYVRAGSKTVRRTSLVISPVCPFQARSG